MSADSDALNLSHLSDSIGQMSRVASQPSPALRQSIGAVRKGLPASRLDQMAKLLDVDPSILVDVLGVSERTIERKPSRSARLSPAASDRLSRIDRIYHLATAVFGDADLAAKWLKRPSRPLGEDLPLRLLDTDPGTQQVERELPEIQISFAY
jgi:putative toxin-antitoxin system antitoxin component (TIGR02293 family)